MKKAIKWIAEVAGNAEIAAKLTISQKAVHNHISHIFNKPQVSAREAGLGTNSKIECLL